MQNRSDESSLFLFVVVVVVVFLLVPFFGIGEIFCPDCRCLRASSASSPSPSPSPSCHEELSVERQRQTSLGSASENDQEVKGEVVYAEGIKDTYGSLMTARQRLQ